METSLVPKSNFVKWMIAFTVMFVAVIEVLDITIVNVSLNQMMGAFGATTEEITWILTSYLVASAVTMPLTGLLVKRLGRKKLLLINIVGFLIASMLCGAATNITEMVLFRTLQGVFGAALVPISQFVLRDTFPRNEQGLAMAVWGIGIMTAPVLGPTVGGYITEAFNWRFIFYMNLPICIIAFVLAIIFITETPRDTSTKVDWLGLALMTIGVGCFQTFLDRGNQVDWFHSTTIIILAIIPAVASYLFIVRGWNKPNNVIQLKLFAERNFSTSCLLMLCFCLTLFGIATLQPIMLGTLFGYPPVTTGLVMGPRGLASAVMMMFCPLLMKHIPSRMLIVIGLLISAYGTYQMCSFSLDDSMWVQIYPGIIQGIGMALVLVPISTIAFDYLQKTDIAEAAGLFSFSRSMGTSIGISVMSTIVTRLTQTNWNHLAGNIQPSNPRFKEWLISHHLNLHDPVTMQHIAQQVGSQASMIAFIDAYWVAVLLFLLMIPLAFLLKKPKPKTDGASFGH